MGTMVINKRSLRAIVIGHWGTGGRGLVTGKNGGQGLVTGKNGDWLLEIIVITT